MSRWFWAGAIASALLCGGCDALPSPSGYDAQLKAMHGTDINQVVAELGAPTRVVELARGNRLYVWERRSDLRTEERYVTRVDPQTQRQEVVKQGGERIPIDCTTEIQADANGIIVSTKAEGIACLGVAPNMAGRTPDPAPPQPATPTPAETLPAPPTGPPAAANMPAPPPAADTRAPPLTRPSPLQNRRRTKFRGE